MCDYLGGVEQYKAEYIFYKSKFYQEVEKAGVGIVQKVVKLTGSLLTMVHYSLTQTATKIHSIPKLFIIVCNINSN